MPNGKLVNNISKNRIITAIETIDRRNEKKNTVLCSFGWQSVENKEMNHIKKKQTHDIEW